MHKYERIREAIAVMVTEAGPGARLPTEKELARRFDASTMTVRRALQVLAEAGQLYGSREGHLCGAFSCDQGGLCVYLLHGGAAGFGASGE